MRQYDPNPALSAFVVTIGAILGIVLAVVLDLGGLGVLLMALAGILVAGFLASSVGIIGQRDTGERDDDLPSHYHDY